MRDWRAGEGGTRKVGGGDAEAGFAPGKQTLVEGVDVPDPARMPDPKPTPQQEVPQSPTEMTGIGATIAVERFVTAAKSVQKQWPTLSLDERAGKLGAAANDELDIAGVFTPVEPKLEDMGARLGEFHFKSWTLGLGRQAFSAATLTDKEAADVASTVYHEARHAEQFHRMARMAIGSGMTPEDVTNKSGIPLNVTLHAKQRPLTSNTSKEGKEAHAWFDSVFGAKAAERAAMLKKEPGLRRAYDDAAAEDKRVKADPAATQAQKIEAARKLRDATTTYKTEILDKYHALPEEADGEAVEGKLKGKLLKLP
jgi:hypothetical protein